MVPAAGDAAPIIFTGFNDNLRPPWKLGYYDPLYARLGTDIQQRGLRDNKPLAALGQVLHDADLAEAILDRLLERGTHYVRRGRSYRTRNHKEELTQDAISDAA